MPEQAAARFGASLRKTAYTTPTAARVTSTAGRPAERRGVKR